MQRDEHTAKKSRLEGGRVPPIIANETTTSATSPAPLQEPVRHRRRMAATRHSPGEHSSRLVPNDEPIISDCEIFMLFP